jgi:hypothetical protein
MNKPWRFESIIIDKMTISLKSLHLFYCDCNNGTSNSFKIQGKFSSKYANNHKLILNLLLINWQPAPSETAKYSTIFVEILKANHHL